MPDTQDDPRVGRSMAQLSDALTTFYQHFASIDEVAVAGVERRFTRLRAELVDPEGPDASYRLLVAFLEDLEGERAAWQRTIGSGTTFAATRDAVEQWFADRLAERSPEAGPTAVRYAAAGFLGAVRAWMLQDDGPDRPTAPVLAASLVDVSARVLGPA